MPTGPLPIKVRTAYDVALRYWPAGWSGGRAADARERLGMSEAQMFQLVEVWSHRPETEAAIPAEVRRYRRMRDERARRWGRVG